MNRYSYAYTATIRSDIVRACREQARTTVELAVLLKVSTRAAAFACYHLRKQGRIVGERMGREYRNRAVLKERTVGAEYANNNTGALHGE